MTPNERISELLEKAPEVKQEVKPEVKPKIEVEEDLGDAAVDEVGAMSDLVQEYFKVGLFA
jgi:hypothetical protein